jgi:hypothetical protein
VFNMPMCNKCTWELCALRSGLHHSNLGIFSISFRELGLDARLSNVTGQE